MHAMFIIIKCSTKNSDLTNTQVLTNLQEEAGFTSADGWTAHLWVKTLTIMIRGKETRVTYRIPYLLHDSRRDIITIQHRAWMDTARLCMWIDLQLGPHYAAKRGCAGLVWDNCGPHGTRAVSEMASEWGITLLPLPKNMTDVLQVMDLVVNSPVKASIRRGRTERLFSDFQRWKMRRLEAMVNKKSLPPFNPPKPRVHEGLSALLACHDQPFATQDAFKKTLKASFVDSCIAPWKSDDDHIEFKIYECHKHGSMNPTPHFHAYDREHGLGSMGMALDTLQGVTVETLADANHADLSDDENASEQDSSSDDSDCDL
uniref:DDE-1 domain-containing protein n=1 Tax=Haptolina brevifila TaxID=156173 RepID=A0A7S2MP25_9EUKA